MKPKFLVEDLDSSKISNGKEFDVSDKLYQSRIAFLSKVAENKSIVHLGACDHKDLIEKKIHNNLWLHKRLNDASSKTIGFDINEEAVKFCNNELGWTNIYCCDMISEKEKVKELAQGKWDYLVAGEIIEHVDNPVAFLSAIHENYSDSISRIIVTVPNAFSSNNIKEALKGKEAINTDHRYWFTPYTISKVAYMSGFEPEEIFYADIAYGRIWKMICKLLFPKQICSETIILVAKF